MLERVVSFVDRLRLAGINVSTSEAIDAAAALGAIEWVDREAFRTGLSATLIKSSQHAPVFDSLFDIYFAPIGENDDPAPEAFPEPIIDRLLDALLAMDPRKLDALVREAIARFGEMEPGRPVGGRYYQWKVEQALDLNTLAQRLSELLTQQAGDGSGAGAAGSGTGGGGAGPGEPLRSALAADEAAARVEELRRRIQAVIRSRLITERGPEAMARALVRPLPEDVDFLQASSEELHEIRRTIAVLARRLAARLAYKHHRANSGRLDFRRTIRASLQTGGVPVVPMFKHRTHRPEIVVLCDVSGSVAAFSRFALALLYALGQHFRKIRSFAFVDTIDEVTTFFEGADFEEATTKLRRDAKVVWLDGHSDYGHSLKEFVSRYPDAITPRTTVLLLGDVRSNFRSSEAWALEEIRAKARKLYLLNPEPRRHWDTGDSIVSAYAGFCDGVYECRNLKQLAGFIERIA